MKNSKNKFRKIIITIFILTAILTSSHFLVKKTISFKRLGSIHHPVQNIIAEKPLETTVYFNNNVEETKAIEEIRQFLQKAQHSIEIAIFSFNSNRLKETLYQAAQKGIKVTLILNKSTRFQHDKIFTNLPHEITRIDVGSHDRNNSKNTLYMHHKFILIDRGYPSQELLTGSFDFTDIGEKYVQSFFLTTSDDALISVYGKEFDLLKKGISGLSKLKQRSYEPWAAKIQYQNEFVEVWMSPGFSKNSIKYRVLELINSAQSSIDFMIWDFTDERIAQALIKKSLAGVKVRIIAEDTNAYTPHSMIPFLLSKKEKNNLSNIEIILDTKSKMLITERVSGGFNPYLHQHTMIFDGKTTVFGTNNWSFWGFYRNDEDMLITNNAYLTNEFQKTFNFFYQTLK